MRSCLCILALSLAASWAAENARVAAVPVPGSPYLPRIYKYVDSLLEDARQTANFHHHQNLLRLLYTLSELSGKPKYRDAADAALRRWLEDIPGPNEPIVRPWLLWNRCFQIAPDASTRFALGVLKNRTTNHPGFYLRTCSAAYTHTTNDVFLRAIEDFVNGFENAPSVSLAIDCDGVSRALPEKPASRLRALAQRADGAVHASTRPAAAMMYVSRYENTGGVAYRDAIHAAATDALKGEIAILEPVALGQSISLQLAAWRSTANERHLEKARAFADFALNEFFQGAPAIVRGVDTLALALVELHLHILYITAFRYPPNTIDR